MKKLLSIVVASTAVALPAAAAGAATAETVVPASSFNNLSRYWGNAYPWGSDHYGAAHMLVGQEGTRNGTLTLTALRRAGLGPNTSEWPGIPMTYVSGAVYSKAPVTVTDAYPVWDVSGDFKAPTAVGSWPAFWLLAQDVWPPEIDILEQMGSATEQVSVWQAPDRADQAWKWLPDSATTWHHYAAHLVKVGNDVRVAFTIDGKDLATFTGAGYAGHPFWAIIDLQMEAVSGTPGPSSAVMQARNVLITRQRA